MSSEQQVGRYCVVQGLGKKKGSALLFNCVTVKRWFGKAKETGILLMVFLDAPVAGMN